MKKSSAQNEVDEQEIKLKFLYDDLRKKRLDARSRLLLDTSVLLTILFTVIFSFYSLIAPSSIKDILWFPFVPNSSNKNYNEVNSLRTQIITLQESVNDIKNQLEAVKNQPSENKDFYSVNLQLTKLKSDINNLNETILEKPDTAITAKLLREKQTTIDQKILDINNTQQRLEGRVDSFLSNLIAVPVFAAIAGFIFTVIAALISPILTKIKDRFFGKYEIHTEDLLGSNNS